MGEARLQVKCSTVQDILEAKTWSLEFIHSVAKSPRRSCHGDGDGDGDGWLNILLLGARRNAYGGVQLLLLC